MTPSPINFSPRLRELLLDLVWQQWSLLGVAGHGSKEPNWAVDLEALILVTSTHGRADPRLFDEMLDWLWDHAQWVNLQRLRNIRKHLALGDARVLAAIADWLGQRATLRKWKTLFSDAPQASTPETLFRLPDGREIPWNGEPDPIFARHGLLRDTVQRRELSRAPNPKPAAALNWKLRGLFGVQARCEILHWLLTHDSGHPAEISRVTYYFPRTVELILREIEASGLAKSSRRGRSVAYRLNAADWQFLVTWSSPHGFPRWIDWPRVFYIHDELIQAGSPSEMSPLLLASELRRVIEKLAPEIEIAGLNTSLTVCPNDTGRAFTDVLLRDIERMHTAL
jgi:hypothetical protein